MNDFIEKPPFINKSLAMLIIGFLFGFLVCYTWPSTNDTDTGATISTIKEQQHIIDKEINDVGKRIENASQTTVRAAETINGVQERIGVSERIVIENTNRIDRIEEIVRDCRKLAEENARIIDNVGKTN